MNLELVAVDGLTVAEAAAALNIRQVTARVGYLSPSQLAVTHGHPGSVERLVPTSEPLTCTTTPPPPNSGHHR